MLFTLVTKPAAGLVDTAVISRLGADSLAAFGVGNMLLSRIFWIFNFPGIGSQTEASQARGKGDMSHGACIGSLALTLPWKPSWR